MANIQSQIKRNRQNEKRRLRNKAVRSTVKTSMKKFHRAADEGDAAAAADAFRQAARGLDKAAEKGVVQRNYAANKKSKMAKRLASLA
jgi:small subunit ribosomal protein S20